MYTIPILKISVTEQYQHQRVKHSVKEFVNGMAHTNGIESFRALLKRGYYGTFHHLSYIHLNRYINEFATSHNRKDFDTIAQINQAMRNSLGNGLLKTYLCKITGGTK